MAVLVHRKSQAPLCKSPPPSAHPDRRAPSEQPAPVERPTASAGARWIVQADVERRGTGKAKGTWIKERSAKMYAATEEAATLKQQEYINDYLHPKKRQKKAAAALPAGNSSAEASSSGSSPAPFEPLPRRASAPISLAEVKGPNAPQAPRAGPGEPLAAPTSPGSFSGVPGAFLLGFSRAPACAWRAQRTA